MGSIDVSTKPLTQAELTARYRNIPGRLELNACGQIIMTPPADVWHKRLPGRLARLLMASLGGEAFQEGAIAVEGGGTPIADVVWCSAEFLIAHGRDKILQRAPEICVEILSRSNSTKEMDDKRHAYFAAGAREVWIVDPQGETIAFHGPEGLRPASAYAVKLLDLFSR